MRITFTEQTLTIAGACTNVNIRQNIAKLHPEVLASSPLTVDLSHVTHVDSAGLAWLINLKRDANACKVEVIFSQIPDNLRDLAALSNAESLLTS